MVILRRDCTDSRSVVLQARYGPCRPVLKGGSTGEEGAMAEAYLCALAVTGAMVGSVV